MTTMTGQLQGERDPTPAALDLIGDYQPHSSNDVLEILQQAAVLRLREKGVNSSIDVGFHKHLTTDGYTFSAFIPGRQQQTFVTYLQREHGLTVDKIRYAGKQLADRIIVRESSHSVRRD